MIHNNTTSQTSHSNVPAWTQILAPDSKPRFGHASVLWENYILTFGGRQSNDKSYSALHAFDLITQTAVIPKRTATREKQVSRYAHSMCLDQRGNAIIFGGSNSPGSSVMGSCAGFHVFIPEGGQLTITWNTTEEWEAVNDQDECPCLFNHTAHIYNEKMYVFGGTNSDGQFTNDLWELDLGISSWSKCKTTGQIPERYSSHSSAICDHKLYIFGRSPNTGLLNLQLDCFSMLDLKTFQWDSIKPIGKTPSLIATSTTMHEYKGKLILFGNPDVNNTNELWSFCPQTNTWTQIQFLGESQLSRVDYTSVIWKDQLFILGGQGSKNKSGFDIWSLCLENNSQDSISVPEAKGRGLKIENDLFPLIELFTQKSFTDIILEVEGKEFASHKAILAQRCKFFANLFSSGMSDSNLSKLPIMGVKADSFEIMLRFIYNDPDLIIYENQALELLSLSDKYLIPSLKTQCEKVLIQLLTLQNFVKIAKAAEVVESDEIKKAVFKFAKENINVLKDKGDLQSLSQSLLVELFTNVVSK